MSRLLGPLLLKNRRFWGWFVPKNFQWLHLLFSGSVIWWTAFWVICPWNEFEETKQCAVHEIQNFFWPKAFFWSIMKMAVRIFFHNMSQGLPNPGFIQEKVQKGDFLKKDSRESNFFSCFRFLWTSRRPGMLNWERVVFCHLKTYTGSVCTQCN